MTDRTNERFGDFVLDERASEYRLVQLDPSWLSAEGSDMRGQIEREIVRRYIATDVRTPVLRRLLLYDIPSAIDDHDSPTEHRSLAERQDEWHAGVSTTLHALDMVSAVWTIDEQPPARHPCYQVRFLILGRLDHPGATLPIQDGFSTCASTEWSARFDKLWASEGAIEHHPPPDKWRS